MSSTPPNGSQLQGSAPRRLKPNVGIFPSPARSFSPPLRIRDAAQRTDPHLPRLRQALVGPVTRAKRFFPGIEDALHRFPLGLGRPGNQENEAKGRRVTLEEDSSGTALPFPHTQHVQVPPQGRAETLSRIVSSKELLLPGQGNRIPGTSRRWLSYVSLVHLSSSVTLGVAS